MPKVVSNNASLGRPATNAEAREAQLIALAYDRAEQQIREGTASSQVISHFLKLGSTKEKLERERLEQENQLLRAKTEALESEKRSEELYEKAIKSMALYSGKEFDDDSDDDEYEGDDYDYD